jgi:hypothetical protein
MTFQRTCVAICFIGACAPAAYAQQDLSERTRRAHQVVVGTVIDVAPTFENSTDGEQIIVSQVTVRVDETLKGNSESVLTLKLEGGTVGDLTLTVSDMPVMEVEDRAVFFLDRVAPGQYKPRDRGLGVMKLDRTNRVRENGLALDDIRNVVRRTGR